MDNFSLAPIGYIKSKLKYRYETPRQGVLSQNNFSIIKLKNKMNFNQAIEGLEGFDRIWVIYIFHLNENWKPKVHPPRHFYKKIGVFATRSPHRPNKIGLSCVKLEKIEGLNIYISESDILDGTPIIDIKPYLPYSDSFPESKTGWVKYNLNDKFLVNYNELADKQMEFLYSKFDINLKNFSALQLEFEPVNTDRKRITQIDESNYILSYRTWRIYYKVDFENKIIIINEVKSGYTNDELKDIEIDNYNDKQIHFNFLNQIF